VKIVAVFGGGGAKATAQIGAQRALKVAGLTPTEYIGTSLGAVVACAFAAGMDADTVLARIGGIRREDVAVNRPFLLLRALFLDSLLKPGPLRETFERLIPARRFQELAIPLTVTAVDVASGELVLFGHRGRDVPLMDALAATTALPLYYPAVEIDGRRYLDGGLRAVLPLEVAAEAGADLVVAVNVGPGGDETAAESAPSLPALVRAHDEMTGVLMEENIRSHLAIWRGSGGRPPLVYVRPSLPREATFRVDAAARFADEGARATKEAVAAWRENAPGPR
jgi:predicted acylesterase/phospholipase RssA